MYNWLEAVYLKQVVPPELLVCSLEDPGSNLRSSTCFFVFLRLSLVCFLRLRELHLLEVRLTDFYSFFLHGHSCSKESRCKLQRMKNGFHQNALFTISLQKQVSLR